MPLKYSTTNAKPTTRIHAINHIKDREDKDYYLIAMKVKNKADNILGEGCFNKAYLVYDIDAGQPRVYRALKDELKLPFPLFPLFPLFMFR